MGEAAVPVAVSEMLPAIERTQLDRHPVLCYLGRLSPGSRPTMLAALQTIARVLAGHDRDVYQMPWHQVRYQHGTVLRSKLADRYAPASANKMLAALRGVLRECWRLGLISAEDFHRTIDLEPVRGTRLPAGRGLSQGEVRALCAACDEDLSPAGRRNAACLALLYGAGLRRSEAVQLQIGDFEPKNGAITVQKGKGNKARVTYLPEAAREAVVSWIVIRGSLSGPLLTPVTKVGRVALRPMTAQAILYIVRRLAERAGVRRFSPHDCRRSMISDLLDAGVDLATVQQLAGHSSPTVTARYDRRGERAKMKGASALHMPFTHSGG